MQEFLTQLYLLDNEPVEQSLAPELSPIDRSVLLVNHGLEELIGRNLNIAGLTPLIGD